MDKSIFKLSIKEETEMHLICALLNLDAGFDISCNNAIVLNKSEIGWAVEWEEYFNPHAKDSVQIERIIFYIDQLVLAATCFVVLRRELQIGDDYYNSNSDHRLGAKLKDFRDLINELKWQNKNE